MLIHDGWVTYPMTKLLNDLEESLKKYPPIAMGTPDPYHPPNQGEVARSREFPKNTARTALKSRSVPNRRLLVSKSFRIARDPGTIADESHLTAAT